MNQYIILIFLIPARMLLIFYTIDAFRGDWIMITVTLVCAVLTIILSIYLLGGNKWLN